MSWIELQIDRANRALWYLCAMIIRGITRVRKQQVFLWSYRFNQYACNPRYLSEYILDNTNGWDVYWAFNKDYDTSAVDRRIKIVRYPSFSYLFAMYSSKYVITNLRNDRFGTFFKKKHNQKYLMLWHGSTPLKRIEKDAEFELGPQYVKRGIDDSSMCDLMISNCDFFTDILQRAFWYNGEILKCGLPRNSVFFDKSFVSKSREDLNNYCRFDKDSLVVLYAPTFRNGSNSLDPYRMRWDQIIPTLEKTFKKRVSVFIRLHPNLIGLDLSSLLEDADIKDVTRYPDMQSLLCAADILITDYSSSMFDFSIFKKPCFLYTPDLDKYNRGFYFMFSELPYPLARNEGELCELISCFNTSLYLEKLKTFMEESIGMKEDGNGSEMIFRWMVNN